MKNSAFTFPTVSQLNAFFDKWWAKRPANIVGSETGKMCENCVDWFVDIYASEDDCDELVELVYEKSCDWQKKNEIDS